MKSNQLAAICRSAFVLVLFLSYPLFAQVPRTINYQGYLTDAAGTPKNGSFSMAFKLYSASGGGTSLWSEIQPAVAVANGLFNVALGSVTPLALAFDTQYYLGVAVGADPEMTPRPALTSSPYALMAANVSSATYSKWTPFGETIFTSTNSGAALRYLWLAKAQGTTMLVKVCVINQGGATVSPVCYGSTVLPEPGAAGPWVPAFADTANPLLAPGAIALGVAWFSAGGTTVLACWAQAAVFAAPSCSPAVAIGN